MTKRPTSFNIFVFAIIAFISSSLLSFLKIDVLFAVVLAVIFFITMIFTIIGFFSGLKFKGEDVKSKLYNKVGLIGNLVLFIVILSLLFLALL